MIHQPVTQPVTHQPVKSDVMVGVLGLSESLFWSGFQHACLTESVVYLRQYRFW
ncbi:MAG: hypothetical protein AB8B99_07365 [Phormidesmis sp.]